MELAFVGDVMLGRLVNDHLRMAAPIYPWGDTLPILERADLRIANLECVLADRGEPWMPEQKAFHFRSDAGNSAVLTAAHIDAVSLANNHTLDFGERAMLEMVDVLGGAGIAHAGAGRNQTEARRPALLHRSGLRIALLSCTDNEPAWAAGEKRAGVWYVPIDPDDRRARDLFARVDNARRDADLVIVALHWGSNWGYRPEREHVPFAHALIDHGADIVYGHSCHVFRGVEIHRRRPILYGTGDFIDDYAVDETERNDESFVFMIEWPQAADRGLRLYPTTIDTFQARIARGERRREIAARMRGLCDELETPAYWHEEGYLEIAIH